MSVDRETVRARIAELDKWLSDHGRKGECADRFRKRPTNLLEITIARETRAILEWADSVETLTGGGRRPSVEALRFIVAQIEQSEQIIADTKRCLAANGG